MEIIKNKIFFSSLIFFFPSNLEEVIKDESLKRKYKRITIHSYKNIKPAYNYRKREKLTYIIDLKSRKADEIFHKFNAQTRNKINRTKRIDNLVFVDNDKNFEENYNLYSAHEYLQSRVPEAKDYFGQIKFFSAYLDGELIANVGCVFVEDRIIRVVNISSRRLKIGQKEKYKIISFASRKIIYNICKYGIENNFELFDFCGINFDDPKKRGIKEFKLGFNGAVVPEYIYTYEHILFKLLKKAVKAKNIKIILKKFKI